MRNEILLLLFITIGITIISFIMYQLFVNMKKCKKTSNQDKSEINAISKELYEKLKTIKPNEYGYYPCIVTLKNGKIQDRVYIVDTKTFIKTWGYHPSEEKAKRLIQINDITNVMESPSRLPSYYANKLHKAGETRMGSVIAEYIFSDGTTQSLINAHDFIEYPNGKTAKDIKDVISHKWNKDDLKNGPQFYYSIYDGIES
ncbi:MAG: hypothetical protein PHC68_14935 [Syntrophorhabdaceae bacterium]|nr:hypothetical protein [Syntrophorhabdaceae bacterium]